MFVSSYSTYIDATANKKVENKKSQVSSKPSEHFSSKLLQTTPQSEVILSKKLPLNYISNYKSLYNRQQLQEKDLQTNPAKIKFSKLSSITNAQASYSENSKMFSLFIKPKTTLDQTPKVEKNQESVMRAKMVNTYIANDKYYNITAA